MAREKKRRKASDRGVPVSVWLKLGLMVRLDRAADRAGISRSEFVERALERELDPRHEAPAAA